MDRGVPYSPTRVAVAGWPLPLSRQTRNFPPPPRDSVAVESVGAIRGVTTVVPSIAVIVSYLVGMVNRARSQQRRSSFSWFSFVGSLIGVSLSLPIVGTTGTLEQMWIPRIAREPIVGGIALVPRGVVLVVVAVMVVLVAEMVMAVLLLLLLLMMMRILAVPTTLTRCHRPDVTTR